MCVQVCGMCVSESAHTCWASRVWTCVLQVGSRIMIRLVFEVWALERTDLSLTVSQ